jgi:RNA polymerase sigma factor (TIGR02999 family)
MTRQDITQLLIEMRKDRDGAVQDLLPAVYAELRRMARSQLRRSGPDPTLNTTALVHEAYLKLFDQTRVEWQDRKHFFSVAAIAMRHILVDASRRKGSKKRGGDYRKVDIEAGDLPSPEGNVDFLSLDRALRRLSEVDERLVRIVELRFFSGLSVEETADVLEINSRTVKRDWRKAKAFLYRSMTAGDAS